MLTYLHGLRGPDFLQVTLLPLRTFCNVIFGKEGEVVLKFLGQGGGEVLDDGVGLIHSSRCGIPDDAGRDDVPRRYQLEVHVIMRRGHGEGPLNAEAEGALGMLGNPTA